MPDSRVENEIIVLLGEGYSIDMYCVKHNDLPKEEQENGFRILREIPKNVHRPFSKEFRSFVKEFVNNLSQMEFDIVHCHDFRMFFLGCEIKKKKPEITLVYDSHEYLAGYPYYRRSKELKARIKGFFIWNYYFQKERRNLNKADHIITVSQTLLDLLVKRSGKPGILLRNLPPTTQKCTGTCNYWHKKFNLTPETKIIIHTGTAQFSGYRRTFLLECVEEDPNLALVFLGSSRTTEEMKSVVEEKKLKSTFFHDSVNRSEITYYCSQADIGLVYTWNKKWTSYWYALPNKMMDVSLSGIPVLSTEQPELKKFIDEFQHGITFNGEEKSSLKEAIQLLLEKYDVLKSSAEKIAAKFNWEIESRKLIGLYQQIEKS